MDCTRHRIRTGVRSFRPAIAAILLWLLWSPGSSRAQFTSRDGQIIARALSFIEPATGGTLVIAIAYAPERPVSVREADSMKAVIGDGLVAGRVTLQSRLVPISQLPGVRGVAGIFVTGGLDNQLDAVARAAERLHVPTISTEMACVRARRCILGFSSTPTVEIVLNHDAANDAGVHFTQAFRMLVREQ